MSQGYAGSGYAGDHGLLTGLGDDDHLQYVLVNGTRAFTGSQAFNAGLNVASTQYIVQYTTGVEAFELLADSSRTWSINDLSGTVTTRFIMRSKGAAIDPGDIKFSGATGASILFWDESVSRWETSTRMYSQADARLYEIEGHTHVEADITDLSHVDPNAIHDNVAAEISLITAKASAIAADLLLIEDSAASNAKKKITVGSLPYVVNSTLYLTFSLSGNLAVSTGTLRIPMTFAATIKNVRLAVNTAPAGASVIVDVNKGGTTIFTTQANRPTVAAAGTDSGNAVPDVTALAAGDYLQVDVDQVGSTTAGADGVVIVELTKD